MGGREHTRFDVFPTGTLSASFNTPVYETIGARGLLLLFDCTAVAGGGTLDAKVQAETFKGSGTYYDIDGAAIAQIVGATQKLLEIYPGLTESGNKKVSVVLPGRWRIVFTVGGTSLAITITAEVLW